jgi:hypothetical protein
MKITRRKDCLYIKEHRVAVKQHFCTIKKVFIAPSKEENLARNRNTKRVDLVLVFPCMFSMKDTEHRYAIITGEWGDPEKLANEYKETIERFISEWQAKQPVV